MASAMKKNVGSMPCTDPECEIHEKKRPVIVMITEKGRLSFSCDICRSKQYASPGEPIYDRWMKRIKKDVTEKPVAAAVVVLPLVKSGAFDMGTL